MDYNIWFSFLAYACLTALSPGPNNILALNATAMNGLSKSRKLLVGIYSGFFSVMVLSALLSTSLIRFVPNALEIMKYAGAIYILWLAYNVAMSQPHQSGGDSVINSFWRGYLLQFVNVKIILWAITAYTGFILPHYNDLFIILAFVILLAAIGNVATFIWAITGATFSSFLTKYWRSSNGLMALMLIYSAITLLY